MNYAAEWTTCAIAGFGIGVAVAEAEMRDLLPTLPPTGWVRWVFLGSLGAMGGGVVHQIFQLAR